MATDAQKYCNEFEELSNDIIHEIFKGYDVDIKPTKEKKDGGYDTIVTIFHENKVEKIYFEHKLRSNNLNLRDISANIIIAFNEGAISLVIMTNKEYTAQAQDNLESFSRKTILNIKLFVGEDIKNFCEEHKLQINQHLTPMLVKSVTWGKNEYDLLKLNLDNQDLVSQILNKVSRSLTEKEPFIIKEYREQYNELCNHIYQGHSVTLRGPIGVGKNTMITYCAQINNFRLIPIDASVYKTAKECLLGILIDMWGIAPDDSDLFLSADQIDDVCDMLKENKEFEHGKENELYHILHYLLSKDEKIGVNYENFNYFICNYIVKGIRIHDDETYVIYIKNIRDAFPEIKTLLNYLCAQMEEQGIACIVKEDEAEFDIQEEIRSLNGGECFFKARKYSLEIPLLKEEGADRYIKYAVPHIPQSIRKDIIRHLGCRLLVLSSFLSVNKSGSINERLRQIPAGSLPEVINHSIKKALSKAPSIFYALALCNHEIPISLISDLISDEDFSILEDLLSVGYLVLDDNKIISSSTIIKQNINVLISRKHNIQMYAYASKLLDKEIIDDNLFPSIYANVLLYSRQIEEGCKKLISIAEISKRERQYNAFIYMAEKLLNYSISPLIKAELLTDILQICSIQRNINLNYVKKYFEQFSDIIDTLMSNDKYNYLKKLCYFRARTDFKNGNFNKCISDTEKAFKISLKGSVDIWNNRMAWMHVLCIKELQGYEAALKAFEAIRTTCPSDRTIEKGYLSHLACIKLASDPIESARIYRNMIDNWERNPQIIYELPFHEYVDVAMALTCAKKTIEAYDECMKVIPILESNGVMTELGRLYNIRGCINIMNDEPENAKKDFQTSVSLFAESPYGLYDYRAKLNLAMSFLTIHDKDACISLISEVYPFFKKHFMERITNLFAKDKEQRIYLALVKLLRMAEATKCQYIVDGLLDLPEIGDRKKQIINDCHSIMHNNSFVHNNEILLMG